MEFRLTYKGPLPAVGTATDKQAIRRALHHQLRKLWKLDPHLANWPLSHPNPENFSSKIEELAHNYTIAGTQFVPLITEKLGLMCSLDVLFLRRYVLGEVEHTGGDLDNRIKTLLDALRTPNNREECGKEVLEADEQPMFTLMSSDALVADLRIESDRLLTETSLHGSAAMKDSELVIKVKTRIVDYYKGYPNPHFA